MTELGGLLAAALLKVVAEQIGSEIGRQIALQKNFSKDLEKMKMALESVEAVLGDAETRSITDRSTCLWLKRLKVAMYAISDMIDEFDIPQPPKDKFLMKIYVGVMILCLKFGHKITLANKMRTMRVDLDEITAQHKKFNLLASTNATELKVSDERETSSKMYEMIFGRSEERDEILASLSKSMKKEITILPIYGIGGLGKTTLAQMLYGSSQFKDYSRVWVYVSREFDMKKIGNSIISQLSEKESRYTEIQMLNNSLSKLFIDKKILVVLDDLWEDNRIYLDKLKGMLNVGNGCNVVVIVTTRSESIAMEVSTLQPHKLAPLSNGLCWSIIKHKSGFKSRGDKNELKQIGKDIASKCGGVALAAQSLGYVLQSMTSHQWKLMRDSDIWSTSNSKDMSFTCVLASLRLSYSVMPAHLKLCFLYCAMFSKGQKLVKDDLIHQCLALAFIERTEVYSSWEIGEIYIRQLLGLSFLRHSESPLAAGVHLEDATLFTMHDLVHDLARSVMVDEILLPDKHGNTVGSCGRYALLNDCSKPLESSKIRALRFMDCGEIDLDGAAFSSANSLRILDLSECSIHKLPDSIGKLKRLRYLNAPRIKHATIPNSITRLSKLTYLNLQGSSISALPRSIGDMEGLLYVDLSACYGIRELPESFGRLTKLVHLDLSNCYRVGNVSELLGSLTKLQYLNLSYCGYIGKLPADLGCLFELQYLNLSFSSYLQFCKNAEVLGSLTKLKYLNLSSRNGFIQKVPEAFGRFSELRYLNLSGWEYLKEPPTAIGNLRELRYLNLSRCLVCGSNQTAIFINSISALSSLEHLDLSHNWAVQSIPANLCNLRKLHTLVLSNCDNLKEIPESIGTIDSLKFLYVTFISEPPQLGSNAVSLPRFVVYTRDGESRSNLVLLQHMDPVELSIIRLENVKTAEEARSIELIGKQSMNKLELNWTRDTERFVDDNILLEKLVPPSTLEKLEIRGYSSGSFPAWLMDITYYLPNLVRFELCNLTNCNVLPPLSQLSNLKFLSLRDLERLEEWNTPYSIGQEHVIERLEIHDCPKLKIKALPLRAKWLGISLSDSVLSSWGEYYGSPTTSYPGDTTTLHVGQSKLREWLFLRHLPSLTCLEITGWGDLTGSAEFIQDLSSLKSLLLEDRDQEELPEWLGELTSLQELKIEKCSGLKELHESMRQLTELQSLKLDRCSRFTSLPHWLGELASLKKLEILFCDSIRSLLAGIQQLTNLQKLHISRCPALRKWCDLEEEKMILTSNQERACVLPTSLRDLAIVGCYRISSLPEGIQQLTNLKYLNIQSCYALSQWCDLEENKIKLAHIEIKWICV